MIDYTKRNTAVRSDAASFDAGLRKYMLRVYDFMVIGLGITGLVAYAVASSPALIQSIFGTPLAWVVIFSPLIFVFIIGGMMNRMSDKAAMAAFFAFSAVMGLSMSLLFTVYTGASIAKAFFITAAVFGSMSLYGYTTKKDLTSIGSFLIMGVWGLIIASIVNIFLRSPGLDFALSAICVVVFTGLTAYDTQRIKQLYYVSPDNYTKIAVMGALSLYLDVINLFQAILHFVGQSRN